MLYWRDCWNNNTKASKLFMTLAVVCKKHAKNVAETHQTGSWVLMGEGLQGVISLVCSECPTLEIPLFYWNEKCRVNVSP